MTFEELIQKPIEDLTDEEVEEIASKMRLDRLAVLERKIRKTVKKRTKPKKVKEAKSMVNDLIAKGLGNEN